MLIRISRVQQLSIQSNNVLRPSDWFQSCQNSLEQYLDHLLGQLNGVDSTLMRAMRHSLLEGGKRFRANLVFATGKAVGIKPDILLPVAAAIEAMHAYSLVHDDMPCMDNDLIRRGKPTCHVQFGQAMALLAGDALQTLSFDCLANHSAFSPAVRLRQIQVLTQAAGAEGMANGQAIDLNHVGLSMSLQALKSMHARKTGDLIVAAVKMGYLVAEELDAECQQALNDYAQVLGFAYQVVDDILDVESSVEALGKTPGKDAAANKPTITRLLGLSESKSLLDQLRAEALQACDRLASPQDDCLRALVNLIVERKS